jgi:hypothetical protein
MVRSFIVLRGASCSPRVHSYTLLLFRCRIDDPSDSCPAAVPALRQPPFSAGHARHQGLSEQSSLQRYLCSVESPPGKPQKPQFFAQYCGPVRNAVLACAAAADAHLGDKEQGALYGTRATDLGTRVMALGTFCTDWQDTKGKQSWDNATGVRCLYCNCRERVEPSA